MAVFGQKAEDTPVQRPFSSDQTLRVDVDLVLINATVTDSNNRSVTGLQKEDFQIFEDKVEQEIQYFSSEDVALTTGILFDVSGSMTNMLSAARRAAVTFLRMGNPDDEYFLIEFSNAPHITQDFTSDIAALQHRLAFTDAKGRTSLYDAVYLGLDKVNRGNNSRKALILITDGLDNRSRYSFSNVKELARELDVQIYGIGIVDPAAAQLGYGYGGAGVINDLTKLTGGSAFFPRFAQQLEDICATIGRDLKNQYVLGYRSSNETNDGKWRKVKVKANRQKGTPRLNVRARTGYYAPTLMNTKK
jgi:Ca-activated chloride channel family protein